MYEVLTDLDVLYDAFEKSKMGVDWKCSIQKYEYNLLPELIKLRRKLLEGKYKQKPFFEFDINERGKHRHIRSLHISDRVLQRALCDQILIPVFYRYLIYDNGASVKGKGIEFTRQRL
ncbi:MAG: Reverse transcriptase (RNA-dependent DNA polymerase), partial [Butyrivibrio sp.]|nr:Reverse transcriptase (RNA-dependent DNA polymerase) [Butyrivibrio sp.]